MNRGKIFVPISQKRKLVPQKSTVESLAQGSPAEEQKGLLKYLKPPGLLGPRTK